MGELIRREPSLPRTWTRSGSRSALADARVFDLLVIGGGVIGAAAACDAASRGLSVALIEQHDFAGGTSSRSTKLLHGGIRYLPQLRFGLIREGLREQAVLRRTADFLYSDLDFVIPLFAGRGLVNLPTWMTYGPLLPLSLRTGLAMYDRIGRRRGQSRHRRLPGHELAMSFPKLRTADLQGGFAYRDAQTDDARLTITFLKTAVQRFGATAVSRMRASAITTEGDLLRVTLEEGSERSHARARSVVSATWAYPPPPLDGRPAASPARLSKGVHLVYNRDDLALGNQALVLPETDDGRLLFAIPWQGLALVGTTDTPFRGTPSQARPLGPDVDYLEDHLRRYMDVDGASPLAAFAGLRTLTGNGKTAALSRAHTIVRQGPGVFAVAGGKLSSARLIAAEVVDRVCTRLGVEQRSRTAHEPLLGAGVSRGFRYRIRTGVARAGLPEEYADHLVGRYGTEAGAIIDLLAARPRLATLMDPAPVSVAEVAYTARNESVGSVGDFALRRTGLAWSSPDQGLRWTRLIAEELATELNWSRERTVRDAARYRRELEAMGLPWLRHTTPLADAAPDREA